MDELEVFLAVVEEQGFSAAAKRLDATPAAVSRRIKALEQRLGVRLLQRTTRKIQLTESGELYFREVSRLLGDLKNVEQQPLEWLDVRLEFMAKFAVCQDDAGEEGAECRR